MAGVHAEMISSSGALRTRLCNGIDLSARAFSVADEADVARMVNGALNVFIGNFGARLKGTLKQEARRAVDEMVGAIHI